jgi:citrate lyase beta subunit
MTPTARAAAEAVIEAYREQDEHGKSLLQLIGEAIDKAVSEELMLVGKFKVAQIVREIDKAFR